MLKFHTWGSLTATITILSHSTLWFGFGYLKMRNQEFTINFKSVRQSQPPTLDCRRGTYPACSTAVPEVWEEDNSYPPKARCSPIVVAGGTFGERTFFMHRVAFKAQKLFCGYVRSQGNYCWGEKQSTITITFSARPSIYSLHSFGLLR